MSKSSPQLLITGNGLNQAQIDKIRKELKQQLKEADVDVSFVRKSKSARNMSVSASLLLNIGAETVVKEVAKKLVLAIAEKIHLQENLKIVFRHAEDFFTGDVPQVVFDSSSLGHNKEKLKELLKAFGVDPDQGEKKALLIGCSEYDDPTFEKLSYAHKNAEDIKLVLSNPEYSDFLEPMILPNADLQNVKIGISQFFQDAVEDDLLLLFFSGHGLLSDDRFYIACKDTNYHHIAVTGISISDLNDLIEASKCKRVVVIVDCCYSGNAKETLESFVVGSSDTAQSEEKSIYWLFSCDKDKKTFESDAYQNSVFTKYFLKGITTPEADTNVDGEISLSELEAFVSENIENETSTKISNHFQNVIAETIILAKNTRTIRERQHREHLALLADLHAQDVVTMEFRHECNELSEKYSELPIGEKTKRNELKKKWSLLRDLSDQKIKPSEAIGEWYIDGSENRPLKQQYNYSHWLMSIAFALMAGGLAWFVNEYINDHEKIVKSRTAPLNQEIQGLQVRIQTLESEKKELQSIPDSLQASYLASEQEKSVLQSTVKRLQDSLQKKINESDETKAKNEAAVEGLKAKNKSAIEELKADNIAAYAELQTKYENVLLENKKLVQELEGNSRSRQVGQPSGCAKYDGFYDGTRIYTNPPQDRIESCTPRFSTDGPYRFVAEIRECKLSFDSDGRKWRGTIDVSGTIRITDFSPPPKSKLFVEGLLTNARVESGYCGPGTLKLEKR
ncbi:MAG: caspase family protein [Pseudomonadota bacterium]